MNPWLRWRLFLAATTLPGQVIEAIGCVHNAGDDPARARPDFDDRQWNQAFPAIGSPYVWTRCRLELKSLPRTGPIHIGVETFIAWELFVDGQPAGSFGDIRTGFASREQLQHRPILAMTPDRLTITLALRQLPGRFNQVQPAKILAGAEDSIITQFSRQLFERWKQIWPSAIRGLLSLVAGSVLLILYAFSGKTKQAEML